MTVIPCMSTPSFIAAAIMGTIRVALGRGAVWQQVREFTALSRTLPSLSNWKLISLYPFPICIFADYLRLTVVPHRFFHSINSDICYPACDHAFPPAWVTGTAPYFVNAGTLHPFTYDLVIFVIIFAISRVSAFAYHLQTLHWSLKQNSFESWSQNPIHT